MKKSLLLLGFSVLAFAGTGSRYEILPEPTPKPAPAVPGIVPSAPSFSVPEVKKEPEARRREYSFSGSGSLFEVLSLLFSGRSILLEPEVNPGVKVYGNFRGVEDIQQACDLLVRSAGLWCRVEENRIVVGELVEKVLFLPSAIEDIAFTLELDSSLQQQGGGTQTGGPFGPPVAQTGQQSEGDKLSLKTDNKRKDFEDTLKSFLSSRGVLRVDWYSRSVYVRDTRDRVQAIEDFIKSISDYLSQKMEVKLNLSVVITEKDIQTGIDWTTIGKLDIGSKFRVEGQMSAPVTGDPVFTLAFRGNVLNVLLGFLSQLGEVRELISPNLVLTNNVPAKVVRGTQVPYVVPQITTTTGGGGTTQQNFYTVNYVFSGVALSVLGRTDRDGKINLYVKPVYSSVDGFKKFDVGGGVMAEVPQVSMVAQFTHVVMEPDSTVVIGGLVWDGKQKVSTGIPLLDQIPVLNFLFSSQRHINKKAYVLLSIYAKGE